MKSIRTISKSRLNELQDMPSRFRHTISMSSVMLSPVEYQQSIKMAAGIVHEMMDAGFSFTIEAIRNDYNILYGYPGHQDQENRLICMYNTHGRSILLHLLEAEPRLWSVMDGRALDQLMRAQAQAEMEILRDEENRNHAVKPKTGHADSRSCSRILYHPISR